MALAEIGQPLKQRFNFRCVLRKMCGAGLGDGKLLLGALALVLGDHVHVVEHG
jgi:hypothetical protein